MCVPEAVTIYLSPGVKIQADATEVNDIVGLAFKLSLLDLKMVFWKICLTGETAKPFVEHMSMSFTVYKAGMED